MRKILLPFDGTHYSRGAFDFARRINEDEPILLAGAFLPQIDFANSWSYANGGGTMFIPLIEGVDADAVGTNIARFQRDCIQHNIEHRVHEDFSTFALPELRKESRYADLMILGSQQFYEIPSAGHFATWLADINNPILVSGAFGRSGFSQIFKHSFASDAITAYQFPVFIAHR